MLIKKQVLAGLVFFLICGVGCNLQSPVPPPEKEIIIHGLTSYQNDSIIIREILDSNGFTDIAVEDVSSDDYPLGCNCERRIRSLILRNIHVLSLLGLDGLRYLDIQSDSLCSLPNDIGALFGLEKLKITKCSNIDSIPEVIFRLQNLDTLILSSNNLQKLPENIGNMTSLRYICVPNNQIASLPSSIINLKRLETFIISNNKLTLLPDSLHRIISLTQFEVGSNNL